MQQLNTTPLTDAEAAEVHDRVQRFGEERVAQAMAMSRYTLGRLLSGLRTRPATVIACRWYLQQSR